MKILAITVLALILFSCNHIKTNSKDALSQKANWYFDQKNYPNAIIYFDSLISLDSLNGQYYFMRAKSNGWLSNFKNAAEDYYKAISLKYRIPDCYFNLGLNASIQDDDSLAIVYFRKSAELSHNQFSEIPMLIKSSEENIKFHKTDAWKDWQIYKKTGKYPSHVRKDSAELIPVR